MLINLRNQQKHKEQDIAESRLQKLLVQNFTSIFPELQLLQTEYALRGDVRLIGMSGRVDLLAYDKNTYELVIFELKKQHGKNILVQALDYSDFVEENLKEILEGFHELSNQEESRILRKSHSPKLILIAKNFFHPTIKRLRKIRNEVTLIKYRYFEDNHLLLDYVNTSETKAEIKKHKRVQLSDLEVDLDVMKVVEDIIQMDLLLEEVDFKYEFSKLFVNQTKLYEAYIEYSRINQMYPLSRAGFINALKGTSNFVHSINSFRYGKKRTSALEFNI